MISPVIAGVDEAGRGPLAGPVVAASVILDPEYPIEQLNDSKKLSARQRFECYRLIVRYARSWAYATASVDEIDSINIRQASLLAMRRSVSALTIFPSHVLVDGRDVLDIPQPCQAIIKGDQKEPAIMAASIVAKYIRDQMMAVLDDLYPEYLFRKHQGYPTARHLLLLKAHGLTPAHRRSFQPCKNIEE